MSNFNQSKKTSLTAGQYKLVAPFTAYRDGPLKSKADISSKTKEGPTDLSSGDTSALQLPPQIFSGQRLFMPPIKNEKVKIQVDLVKQYFTETSIQATMEKITAQLLRNNVLPYNPYPGYIRRFRRISERFYTGRKTLQEIRQRLDVPVFTVENGYLMGLRAPDVTVWGLEHIVGHVNIKSIETFRPLLLSTVTSDSAAASTGKQIKVFKSLSGPGIFCNSFYNDINFITLRVSILISGQDFKQAVKIFTRVLLDDIRLANSQDSQQILELLVDVGSKNKWTSRHLSYADLHSIFSSNDDGVAKIERMLFDAATAQRNIALRLLSYRSPDQLFDKFLIVSKVYELLYLQDQAPNAQGRTAAGGSPQLISPSKPYQALLEGVFLDLSQAELYVATLQKYSAQSTTRLRRNVSKPYPFDPDILNPFMQDLQTQIASNILEHSAFLIVHKMLLVRLAQARPKSFSNHSEDDVAIQIARLYSGTASSIHGALLLVQTLPILLASTETGRSDANMAMLQKLKDFLLNIFNQCFSSNSSENRILTESLESVFDSALVGGSVNTKKLQLLAGCLSVSLLAFTEDALESCPALISLKSQINAIHPHLVPSFSDVVDQAGSQHGIKNSSWLNVDTTKVDKMKSIFTSQAPPAVAPQFVMMQYCVDIRIDEIWREFLDFLLLEEDHLPPNPHPYLIAILRKGNMSVQVLFESESAQVDRILQRKLIPVEGASEVFNVSGSSAYGRRASLIFFNSAGFRQVTDLATSVVMAPPGETALGLPIQLGNFRLTVCSGVVGHGVYYGSVSPFLSSLEVDEHLFIYGSQDRARDAYSLLSQTVVSGLRRLRSQGSIMHEVRFGPVQLDLLVLVDSAARFESEFTAAVNGNQSIVVSFYYPLAWRYIHVTKRLLIYFVDNLTSRITRLFPYSSATEKRGVTLFLHPNDVSFCMRPGRVLSLSLNASIKATWPSRDWPRLIKLLATHAQLLLSGSGAESRTDIVADGLSGDNLSHSIASFCYRYYNGLPGQIDYLLSLNSGLETIISHAVSALEENVDLTSIIQLKLVDKMVEQYMIKLKETLSRPSALAPASLPDYLLTKMRVVAFRDRNTNSFYVRYEHESVEALREIHGHLTFLRNILAEDLLSVNRVLLKLVQSAS